MTINCAERGLLLLRVRDEINMTLEAYKTIYESSTGFGCRKGNDDVIMNNYESYIMTS